jgi:hypothetical protein
MEIWAEIPGFIDYKVSTMGRIKSYKRNKESILCLKKHKRGYLFVHLRELGKSKKINLHQCVMEVFGPERPPNTTVDHINRIRGDNRIENLRWATDEEQTKNRVLVESKGEKNPSSKLTEHQVIEIKYKLLDKKSSVEISKQYGVSKTTILYIKSGRLWPHIEIN